MKYAKRRIGYEAESAGLGARFRAELDRAAPKHPVMFATGPDASLNSLALKLSGIDRDFKVTDGGSGFAEFVEQPPEAGIGFAFDGVNADGVAVEGKAFEAGEGLFEGAERRHETAVGATIEIFGGAFGGDGKREGMEFFAVLDVLIHIFHDIFGERRREKAAMAQGAMAEFGRTLAPGDDFAAVELFANFVVELVVTRHVAVDNFTVVEDGLDFLSGWFGTERQRS